MCSNRGIDYHDKNLRTGPLVQHWMKGLVDPGLEKPMADQLDVPKVRDPVVYCVPPN